MFKELDFALFSFVVWFVVVVVVVVWFVVVVVVVWFVVVVVVVVVGVWSSPRVADTECVKLTNREVCGECDAKAGFVFELFAELLFETNRGVDTNDVERSLLA